jgi:hypothetical protein
MADDRPRDGDSVVDLVDRLRRSSPAPLAYADQIWIGSRLLTALTACAMALAEMDHPQANRVRVADKIRQAQECLQDAGAALRDPDRRVPIGGS